MDPLRIALLSANGVHGLERLLADPGRGAVWELAIVVDSETPELVELLLQSKVDWVLLAGWSFSVPEELTTAFAGRILAIHEDATRSAIHLVTHDLAHAPLFLLGKSHPVAPMALDARERGDAGFLARYAELHRQWIRASWGEMLARAIELVAGGTLQIIGDVVWIDGAPGPCRMGESPRACHEPEAMIARGIPRSCPFIA